MSREWAILVPSWTIVVVILTYIVYFAIALRATPSFDEMTAISGSTPLTFSIPSYSDLKHLLETDSLVALPSSEVDGANNPYLTSASPHAIPELYDIPIGMVNRVLYHEAHTNN